jgi:regulator of nucleoside diphosphate kinase
VKEDRLPEGIRDMATTRKIYLTKQDMERLQSLVELSSGRDRPFADALEEELGRAIVMPQKKIPPDVVTMNSRVVVEDEKTGAKREITLVFPHASNAEAGKVSVLAPVGAAVLGLKVGESIEWPLPGKRTTRLRIVSVEYQPEASGDFHL